jgi:hypothetical protein
MNDEQIREFVKKGELRKRSTDINRARSILQAAQNSATFAQNIKLTEQTSTGIFKELYDAFRQLGDAKWWMLGCEAYSHKSSIELLKSAKTPHNQSLQQLSRMRDIRDDASYRGYTTPTHTEELLNLWKMTHKELIDWINIPKK